MYNNEEASPAFSTFLELLGEQVLLKGFNKYAAQLDTKSRHRRLSQKFRFSHSQSENICGEQLQVNGLNKPISDLSA